MLIRILNGLLLLTAGFAQGQQWDFVIVGGGTAGLTLASRLSEIPSFNVLVLEAGNDHTQDIKVLCPGIFGSVYGDLEYHWEYTNTPQPYLNNRSHSIMAGKGLGGGSAINFMLWTHASRRDIDMWGDLGNRNWSWKELQPYYKKSEQFVTPSKRVKDHLGVEFLDETVHGKKGPIVNSFPEVYGPFQKAWSKTYEKLGLGVTGDPRGGLALGGFANPFNIDSKTKERSYPGNKHYMSAKERKNLKVVTGALVTKIHTDVRKQGALPTATGVEYVKDGVRHDVWVKKEVIVSAGAIESPKLLELSGIGSPKLLNKLGIRVVVNNGFVGENYQNHLMLPLGFMAKRNLTTAEDFTDPAVFQAAFSEYLTTRTGPLTVVNASSALLSLHQLGGSFSSLPASPKVPNNPGLQAQYNLLLSSLRSNLTASAHEISLAGGVSPWHHNNTKLAFSASPPPPPFPQPSEKDTGKYLTLLTLLQQPFSRGSVHISSPSPARPPVINPNYLSHPIDRHLVRLGALHLQQVASTPPLSALLERGGRAFQPGYPAGGLTEENVDEFVGEYMMLAYHHSGTCAMMPRGRGGVVDGRFRVYGVGGLRVVDASVFPMVPGGTVGSAVVAVAERAGGFVRGEYGFGE
ncbi:putative choline dehydrogenase [Cercophora samala]|uniref:Choline dehydrogenase n=1 Tax=Cercophora samala TaxID=330535 RepID=A0AA40DAW4_9PEZI|nr:putative choline dehydrogenase [Cercophora samala]